MIILWIVIKVIIIMGFTIALAGVLTIADRKQSGAIQDRIGPNRANLSTDVWDLSKRWRFFGLLHLVADAIKMAFKEDFVVAKGHRILHRIAPLLVFIPPLIALSLIPFGGTVTLFDSTTDLHILPLEGGMLMVFALSGLSMFGVALGGYASNSRYALLGSVRALTQMFSYEMVLGLILMGTFLIHESLSPAAIVVAQQSLTAAGDPDLLLGFIPKWGIFLQPLAVILYIIAATAETKRAPFDVPEAESELIAGYFTEYSSMKMGMFLFSEYIEVILFSMLFTTIFLGGYHFPYLYSDGFHLPWGTTLTMNTTLVALLQMITFFGKVIMMAWFHLMIRWTLPRFRYDQVISLCWTKIFPLALGNTAVTALIIILAGGTA